MSMIKDKNIISSSTFVANYLLKRKIVEHNRRSKKEDIINLNEDSSRWLSIFSLIPMTLDVRSRYGSFSTPWKAPVDRSFVTRLPQDTNLNLEEIYDRRAIEIFNSAKSTNRNIVIQWSGGVDSTSMLISFLKNLSLSDQEIITVALSTNSVIEHPQFYKKYISKKLKIINWLDVDVNNEFLSENIILHGDPANCLYGPSGMMYSDLVASGGHLEPWECHIDSMIHSIDRQTSVYPGTVNIGKWYIDKVSRVLEELHLDRIRTVCDWWWWQYFNFKWFGSIVRPLIWCRRDYSAPISKENYEFFSRNAFYAGQEFQDWSFTKLPDLIGVVPTLSYKPDAKKYIIEFDGNRTYYEKKKFQASRAPNQMELEYGKSPVFFDENWVGHYWEDSNTRRDIMSCLDLYRG